MINCGPRKDFVAQFECLASEFGLRKNCSSKKSFKLKCCHEVMVDNCYESWVASQTTVREVMTFFSLEIAPFRAISHDFHRS